MPPLYTYLFANMVAALLLPALLGAATADPRSPLTFACSDANLTEGFACAF